MPSGQLPGERMKLIVDAMYSPLAVAAGHDTTTPTSALTNHLFHKLMYDCLVIECHNHGSINHWPKQVLSPNEKIIQNLRV